MRQKYIIQLWNKRHLYWFDYLTFYNKDNARRMYQHIKKNSIGIRFRLLEVISYDF